MKLRWRTVRAAALIVAVIVIMTSACSNASASPKLTKDTALAGESAQLAAVLDALTPPIGHAIEPNGVPVPCYGGVAGDEYQHSNKFVTRSILHVPVGRYDTVLQQAHDYWTNHGYKVGGGKTANGAFGGSPNYPGWGATKDGFGLIVSVDRDEQSVDFLATSPCVPDPPGFKGPPYGTGDPPFSPTWPLSTTSS